jgi:DNA-binding TFAR19-related protein (PDSD5 family)
VKIRRAAANNHRRAFEITIGNTRFLFPYAKADPAPTRADPVRSVVVDEELAREAITFELRSGRQGFVHAEQALEYNKDPAFERERLLYLLTVEAQERLAESKLSKREIIRRLNTSASQFYRLIDQTNYRKSVDQVIALLRALDCDVNVVVRAKSA